MENTACNKARELFERGIDGELTEKEQELLQKHLAVCETCLCEYRELEAIHKYMSTLAIDVPPELHQSVMASVKKEPRHRLLGARWIRPLAAISAAAMLCIAVMHSPVMDMFKANSKMDNAEAFSPEEEYDFDGIFDMNGGGHLSIETAASEDKSEAYGDMTQEMPEVAFQQVYTVADTDLLLMLINEKQAMLCRRDGGTAEMLLDLTYTKLEGRLVLKDGDKTQTLRVEGDRVYPTDDGTLLAPFTK
ncbi:MAG: zf-HC2 domain-containing protein [Clostridia bacterium]|nr:zf-HC2 domain-containing protein [Clostridia bacterium]